jgi:hypothetical protein
MVIYNFFNMYCIVKADENWPLVLKNSARKVSWPLCPTGQLFLALKKKKLDRLDLGYLWSGFKDGEGKFGLKVEGLSLQYTEIRVPNDEVHKARTK